jgi:signal peptidase II
MLFTVGPAALLALLIAYAIRARLPNVPLLGLTILVAGGASNLANRMMDGRVVDFLNIGIGSVRTGIFNVADMAIMSGATLLLIGAYFQHRTRRHAH